MNVHITSYGQGVPIVFFHGWGFDSHIWLPLAPYLQQQYQLFFVDLPGFGKTPMMNWESFKEGLLFYLPSSFAVVGWSLGGLFATRLAIEESKRISHLVNVASVPRFIVDSEWPGVAKEVFATFHRKLSTSAQKTLEEFISLQLNNKKLDYPVGHLPSLEGLHSGLDILDSWDLRKELVQFSKPTYFMFGRLDPITPARLMNTMELLYPNFHYTLFKKAAHMPFLSDLELFLEHLMRFIR